MAKSPAAYHRVGESLSPTRHALVRHIAYFFIYTGLFTKKKTGTDPVYFTELKNENLLIQILLLFLHLPLHLL